MEKRCLPLNFYCRSARLLLKKASFSRRSNLHAEELRHLRKFSTLASSVIPSHPEYRDVRGRKLAEELEDCMDDVKERITELEEELVGSTACSTSTGYKRAPSLEKQERTTVWEKLVKKLCCSSTSSGKANKSRKLAPPTTGFFSGSRAVSEVTSPFITEVESRSSSSESRKGQLVLDMRHRRIEKQQVEDDDSESSDSGGTAKNKKMTQVAEVKTSGNRRINQIAELNVEGKLPNIQSVVMGMRDSVESLKTRVEEEGKRWRGRVDTLERKLKVIKDESDNDFSGLKQHLQEEVRRATREVNDSQRRHVDIKLEKLAEASCGEVKRARQLITDSLGEVRGDLRSEVNILETGLDNLRQEMGARCESLLSDIETGRIGRIKNDDEVEMAQQLDLLRGDVQVLYRELERLNEEQKTETERLGREQRTEMQRLNDERATEIQRLNEEQRFEMQKLTRDQRIEVHRINEEQRAEMQRITERVQGTKQELMEARVETEVQVREMRHDMTELRGEQEEIKADVEVLKKQPSGGGGLEASNLLMAEKLERFSKLYSSCLDDLQARVNTLESRIRTPSPHVTTFAMIETGSSEAAPPTPPPAPPPPPPPLVEEEPPAASRMNTLHEELGTFLSQILKDGNPPQESSREPEPRNSTKNKAGIGSRKLSVFGGKAKPSQETIFASVAGIENKMKIAAGVLGHRGNESLHKAANFWLQRYEATAKSVTEIESRVQELRLRDELQRQEKQQQRLERVLSLEDRVDQIASATYANLRLLDAKVEHASIGMRSALDIATETEDKCSNLGAELVKVFRLILSTRDSPRSKRNEPGPERGPQEHSPDEHSGPSPRYDPLPARPVKRLSLEKCTACFTVVKSKVKPGKNSQ